MTDFSERAARADAAVDRTFGERVRVYPQARPVGLAETAEDPDRDVVDLRAVVVDERAEDVRADGSGTHQFRARMTGGRITMSLAYASTEVALREGDRVVLFDRPGHPTYRVARVDLEDATRRFVELERC